MPEDLETQPEKPKAKRAPRKPGAQKKQPAPKPPEEAPDGGVAPAKPAEKPKAASKRKAAPRRASQAKQKSPSKAKQDSPAASEQGTAQKGIEPPRRPERADMPDALSAIVADAEEIFRFDPVKGHQDRAHEYLARREVYRGSDDTATEVAVVDLVERAFKSGMLSSGEPLPGLDRVAARLARVGSELIEQSAELLAAGGRR